MSQSSQNSTDSEQRRRQLTRVTLVGSVGNIALMVFKFVAGFLGHSGAMIADAVHSVSDLLSDIVVLIFVKISAKPGDKEHAYGHGKFETLATAIIAIALMGVGAALLYSSAEHIWGAIHGEQLEAPGWIAFIAAILSILIKEGLYHYTLRAARKYNSPAVEANAWHHRSDALSSIGTAVGIGGAILLGQRWRVLDPIAAAIVSLFIIKVGYDLMKPAIDELLERSLPPEIEDKILQAAAEMAEISDPHHLRTRRIGNYAAVDLHVRMDPDMTVGHSHELTRQLEARIRDLLGPGTYVNIHVEPVKEKG